MSSRSLPTGLRIRELRMEKGWSQEQLADAVGATKATISKLERSTMQLNVAWMERITRALGLAEDALFSGDQVLSIRRIPLVGSIPAGNWREAVAEPEGYVDAVGVGPNAFALKPAGTSMNLEVPDGFYAVIDPDDTALRDGKIYALMNARGETTMKQFRAEPARLEPRSSDASHLSIMLGSEPITVIGRAVSVHKSL